MTTTDARKRLAENTAAAPAHTMRFEFRDRSVSAEAVCHAAPADDCRLTAADRHECQCEQWATIIRRDDGTIWHTLTDGYIDRDEPEVMHRLIPGDDCNVCLFINESGCVEELTARTTSFVIGDVPIGPVWVDDGCDWEHLKETTDV